MDTKSIAVVAGAAAAGGVLAFAGLSLANAATGAGDTQSVGQYGNGPMGMGMSRGTPITGEAAEQVTAAVQAKYPDATVDFVEEQDGGYEAHITKADGTRWHVTVSADFVVGEEHQGPEAGMGGPGRGGPHGTPVTGENADKVTEAVLAQYSDATVLFVEEEDGGYEAHVRKADGTMLHVTLDADFAVTGEHEGPTMGGPGGRGPSGEKPLKGAKAKKVTAAAERRIPNGTVVRVETDSDGVYEAHVIKANGKPVIVEVGKRFQVTGVTKMSARGPMGHMGPPPAAGQTPSGGYGYDGGTGTADTTTGA